ncbi:MAG TPA: hypothetical protein VM285_06825 [Polyangia bacterium]|nr:hypothetical protein [Polyangia bacterium]
MNFLCTGYRTDGLLDVHVITDEDFERRSTFAVKISAVTDAARPLEPGPETPRGDDVDGGRGVGI